MAPPGEAWSSAGKSQDEFMLKDTCLAVNYADEVVGFESKYNAHKFLVGQPTGILHRAFSVMLFDADDRLLLQQRASSKVTFAEAWTNTCCSHPLHGLAPTEVDAPEALLTGDPRGVKHAAVRKLKHELGLEGLDASRFAFVTRVHYWAVDQDAKHGGLDRSPWGEHEIDYLLVYKLRRGETLLVTPEPDEVKAFKWVTESELFDAMTNKRLGDEPMPKWSPWFEIIAKRFLRDWWTDLDGLVTARKFADYATIHRFDCHTTRTADKGVGAGGATVGLLDQLDAKLKTSSADKTLLAEATRAHTLRDIASTTHALQQAAAEAAAKKKKKKSSKSAASSSNEATNGHATAAAAPALNKQGAYGKVHTHATKLAAGPLELWAGLRLKLLNVLDSNMESDASGGAHPDVIFCDAMLGKVSRSFAAVIRQLPEGLCLDICVFYLVLRALDTVEDDMEAFKGKEAEKAARLRKFHETELKDRDCSVAGIGEGDEAALLEKFGAVVRVLEDRVPEKSRAVIVDVCQAMASGMADYVTAELAQGTKDVAAYDAYCHAVAGLVGEGLTRIFVARGFEHPSLEDGGELEWPFCGDDNKLGLANSMGLFLQKTNIIRDYLEDYVDGRAFWPQTVWRQYAQTGDLGEFARPTARFKAAAVPPSSSKKKDASRGDYAGAVLAKGADDRSLRCLNALVADALTLVPDALEYLRRCESPRVYRFCAIPQIMAIATLAECFDNPALFTGVVKIRKGLTARIILDTEKGHEATLCWFNHFAQRIAAQLPTAHADADTKQKLASACQRCFDLSDEAVKTQILKSSQTAALFGTVVVLGLGFAIRALFFPGLADAYAAR